MTCIPFLMQNGPMLLFGCTCLLAVGTATLLLQRHPAHRQRTGELTLLAVIVYLLLASLPLPRWQWATSVVPSPTPPPAALDTALLDEQTMARVFRPSNEPAPAAKPAISAEPAVLHPPPSFRSRWDASGWPAIAYLVGAGITLGWLVSGRIMLHRVLRGARSAPTWIAELAIDGLHGRRPRLLVSDLISRPMAFGLFQPTVILPRSMVEQECAIAVQSVLLHELAHLRRGDPWGNALLNLAMIVLWMHPLYWVIRARIALSRELLADDSAARLTGRESYVEQFLALARSRTERSRHPAASLSAFGSKTTFYRRMNMLMQRTTPLLVAPSKSWRVSAGLTVCLAVGLAASLLGVAPARGQAAAEPARFKEQEAETAKLRAERDALRARLELLERQLADQKAVADADPAVRTKLKAWKDKEAVRDEGPEAQKERLAAYEKALKGQQDAALDQARAAKAAEAAGRADYKVAGKPGTPVPPAPEASSRVQLDLIGLGTAHIDAVAQLKIAAIKLSTLKQVVAQKAAPQSELQIAEVNYESAEQKLELLRSIAQAARSAAVADLEITRKLAEVGRAATQSVIEAEAKVKILDTILSAGR